MADSGSIGSRIRYYRRRLGLTQDVLAGRAAVSPTWLSQVERGLLSGSRLATLLPVAEVLGVDLAVLVDTPRKRVPGPGGRPNGVRDVVAALVTYPDHLPGAPDTDLDSIRRRLERAEGLVRLCRFQEAGPLLAALIGDAETAVRTHEATEREKAAYALLSHVYRASTWALVRAGEEQGPRWVASERCSAAARRSGDPVVTGLAADHRSNVYAHAGLVAEAREVLTAAVDALAEAAEAAEQPPGSWVSPEPAAVWGSLLLAAAGWASHANDRADCHRLLRRAEAAEPRVHRDDDLFGITSAAVYQVSCAVQLGDLSEALRLGAAIDTSHFESFDRSRPAALRVSMAQVHELRGQDADALLWLNEAERLAPEWIRGGRPEVREMIGAMLRRERRRRPGLRELADRLGIVD